MEPNFYDCYGTKQGVPGSPDGPPIVLSESEAELKRIADTAQEQIEIFKKQVEAVEQQTKSIGLQADEAKRQADAAEERVKLAKKESRTSRILSIISITIAFAALVFTALTYFKG
ncbi:hypothetical protein [Anaerotruncus colihominis]|uniref:hypothetical protein n=1 Tax=Anaerotruncus colihominis TaxID=169435 RepID=UPI00242C8BEB|nr:hypothetical protein [Anaerotruncus colihominis]